MVRMIKFYEFEATLVKMGMCFKSDFVKFLIVLFVVSWLRMIATHFNGAKHLKMMCMGVKLFLMFHTGCV